VGVRRGNCFWIVWGRSMALGSGRELKHKDNVSHFWTKFGYYFALSLIDL